MIIKRDLSTQDQELLLEKIADISEILLDLPKWIPIYHALKEITEDHADLIKSLKYCIQIDKELKEEMELKKASNG